MIAGRGMDWEFKVRWQFVGLVGGLLEPGRIVDVVNGDNVHDRSLHLFGHEYQCDLPLEFFRFLRDSDQLSSSKRKDARYYIERLDHIKDLLDRQRAIGVPIGEGHP